MRFIVYFFIHYLLFFTAMLYLLLFLFDNSTGSHVDFYLKSATLSVIGISGYIYLFLFSSKPVMNNLFFSFIVGIFQILNILSFRKEVIFTNTLIGRFNMSHLLFISFSWIYLAIMPFINNVAYRQKQLDHIKLIRDKLQISNDIDEQINGQWI